jgi:hypothetical protein
MKAEVLDDTAQTMEELAEKERFGIRALKTLRPHGYNQTEGGEGTIGYRHTSAAKAKLSVARKGKKLSEETKRKISEAGEGRQHPQEIKLKIGLANLGKHRSKEFRSAISLRRKGVKLSQQHRAAIKAGVAWMKGQPRPTNQRQKIKHSHIAKRGNLALLRSTDGVEHEVSDIRTFATEHKLLTSKVYDILNGKRSNHKGWSGQWLLRDGDASKAATASQPKKEFLPRLETMRQKRCIHDYILIDTLGVEHAISNLSDFCKRHGLDQRKMQAVVKGRRKSHLGWRGQITATKMTATAPFTPALP